MDLKLLLCWLNWFYWQVHHLHFLFGKVKKWPCGGHMISTWPRWLLCKSHLEKFKITIFLVKVHFQYILGVQSALHPCTCHFKITCQSSQGHLLSKESIDFLRHCSCLLGKVKDKSFKCKLTEIVMSFLIFLVPMQSQWKNWYSVSSELIYVLQRNLELIFWSRPIPS